ncbi:MAG: hypothetical protein QF707_03760 [Candidatus Poseidoniaceae archaeon]|jgi:hypothetical protein|nr:hypothetical protein [Candidatus Poseidoniaceae archaeon]MDP7202766.1 hypothetical protein [Candidatus Poseidoniaceae archaeon]|tara:strand:- start:292 stop:489 length:198 start_codon:yes stop_codon:yes gene_type:complete
MQGGKAFIDLMIGLLLSAGTFLISWWTSGSFTIGGGITAIQILGTMAFLDLREKQRKENQERGGP